MEVPEPKGNRVLNGRVASLLALELHVVDPKPSDLVMGRLKLE